MDPSSDSQPLAPMPALPLTFGQILERTYRLVRNHLRLFLGIAAVPTIAMVVVMGAIFGSVFSTLWPLITSQAASPQAPPPPLFFALFLVIYPLSLLVCALYLPAAAFATTQANRGIVVTLRQAYSVAWSRFGRSLWLIVLGILYIAVPLLVIALIAALVGVGGAMLGHGAGGGLNPAAAFFLIPLLILLYLGVLVYSVFTMIRFSLAYPACIEEDLPAWKALQRSTQLTRGAKGRIFLVLLVLYAIVYAAEFACILVFFAVAALIGVIALASHVTIGSPVFIVLVSLAVIAYALVIGACVLLSYAGFTSALAVLYHDQRLRESLLAPAPPLA